MKHVRRSRWWWVALLLASGCATPAATKEASRAHGQNLADLKRAVDSYRQALSEYFKKLEAQQREAYIAEMIGREIDQIAQDQFQSLPYASNLNLRFTNPSKATPTPADTTANDFITLGEGLANSYETWGRDFDLRMSVAGMTLADKRAELTRQLEKQKADLEKRKADLEALRASPERDESAIARKEREINLLSRRIRGEEARLQRDDAELTHVGTASALRETAKTLELKLQRLSTQIEVMQTFHGTIDTYLGTDATIDGKAISEAAAKAAALDLSEFPELKALLTQQEAKR
jgi:hypothetical protein